MEREAHNVERYHDALKELMDRYVHGVYRVTKSFPREELYGATSQLRRAALSVILNYLEGYARGKKAVYKNFLEMSYGSLKESNYLLHFSMVESYLSKADYELLVGLADRIGKMLWGIISKIGQK